MGRTSINLWTHDRASSAELVLRSRPCFPRVVQGSSGPLIGTCMVTRRPGLLAQEIVQPAALPKPATLIRQEIYRVQTFVASPQSVAGNQLQQGLVGAAGFEPATFWSQTRRATRLRYAPP